MSRSLRAHFTYLRRTCRMNILKKYLISNTLLISNSSKWINDSYEYWDALQKSEEASDAGVTALSGYIFSSISESIVRVGIELLVILNHRSLNPIFSAHIVESFFGKTFTVLPEMHRRRTQNMPWKLEIRLFLYDRYDRVQNLATVGNAEVTSTNSSIDTINHHEYFYRFQQSGGRVQRTHVTNLTNLASSFDVIMNCSGLGAQQLCNDRKMVPIRGQVIKVRAPWLKTAFYHDYDTYILPGFNGIATLGGVRQYESYNLNISKLRLGFNDKIFRT